MNSEEFERIVTDDAALHGPITRALSQLCKPQAVLGTPTEVATIGAVFPIVFFLLTQIGLPWMHEAKRYSELWRHKFHKWIDDQYVKHGLDPKQAETFSLALRREIDSVKNPAARASWERVVRLFIDDIHHRKNGKRTSRN